MTAWSPKKHELSYRTLEDHRIMMAKYAVNGNSFMPSKPKVWSPGKVGNHLSIAPDGLRFGVLMPLQVPAAQAAMLHVTFVLNFSTNCAAHAGTQIDFSQRSDPLGVPACSWTQRCN
jgi:hypothetical protein